MVTPDGGAVGELVGAPEHGAGVAQQGGDRLGGLRCGERVGIGHAPDSDAISSTQPVTIPPTSTSCLAITATSSPHSLRLAWAVCLILSDIFRARTH